MIPTQLYRSVFLRSLRPMKNGRLEITLPDGSSTHFGEGNGIQAQILVHDEAFFRRCVLFGDIGFGEAYMDGQWSSPEVSHVIAWFIANIENAPTLSGSKRPWSPLNLMGTFNRLYHLARPNHVSGAQRNIREHYDFSNDFFKVWLDPSMTYSSAYFDRPEASLEEAQNAKYDRLLDRLALKPGMTLLEIGSGWGGLSIRAASRYGCKVVSLTLSKNQLEEASRRVQAAGLADKIEFRLEDYRKTTGQFDRIISIEMIEAVGHDYFEDYFAQCHRLLKSDGLLAIQGILCPDSRYDLFRSRVDWIQRHIFPGSLLPSFGRIQQAIRATGDLDLFWFEEMGLHYGQTLRAWNSALHAQAQQIKGLGYNEHELRRWSYYFMYCAAAFEMRNITVAQMVFTRPNNPTLTQLRSGVQS